MTAPVPTPVFLPVDTPIDLVGVGESWAAVSLPSSWGPLVMDVLGDRSGPAFEEPARSRPVWILPACGAADWPGAEDGGVVRYGPGDSILVPGPEGYRDGIRWLRSPLTPLLSTDPVALRAAVEVVLGPLEDAAALGLMVVCRYCRAPTRDGRITESFMGPSGAPRFRYVCPSCWTSTVGGVGGRRLRVVRGVPR